MAKVSVTKAVVAYREAYFTAEAAEIVRNQTREAYDVARREADTANLQLDLAHTELMSAIRAK